MNAAVQARVGVLTLLGIGALAAVFSYGLGLGSPAKPGPGMWPFVVSIAMLVFGVVLLVRPEPDAVEPLDRNMLLVGAGALSLAVYSWLFEVLGFEIPTVLLLLLWLKVFGRDSWRTTITVALVTTVVVYLLFIVALGVSLPHLIAF